MEVDDGVGELSISSMMRWLKLAKSAMRVLSLVTQKRFAGPHIGYEFRPSLIYSIFVVSSAIDGYLLSYMLVLIVRWDLKKFVGNFYLN